MPNWFLTLPAYFETEAEDKEKFQLELLRSFRDFLGKPKQEFSVTFWLCVNYGKISRDPIDQLYDELTNWISAEEISEGFAKLFQEGWIEIKRSSGFSSSYELLFNPQVEMALRTGDQHALRIPINHQKPVNKKIKELYAHALLFKRRKKGLSEWLNNSESFLSRSKTALARFFRSKELDTFSGAVNLYVLVIHALEGKPAEMKSLSHLFSNCPLSARKLYHQWKAPSWKPIKSGLLDKQQRPDGSYLLAPSLDVQHRIFGPATEVVLTEANIPAMLTRLLPADIPERKLFYNDFEADMIRKVSKLLKPGPFNRYQRLTQQEGEVPGVSILLSGGPGTGKTELARQLARSSGRELFLLKVSELRDKYFGESEKHVQEVFENYRAAEQKQRLKPILFINEADSIFQARAERGSCSTTENVMSTILLNELEVFSGILICTTNRPDAFDEAFNRRFLVKLSIQSPDETVRRQLLRHMIPNLPKCLTDDLAGRYRFTGAELDNFRKLYRIQKVVDRQPPAEGAALETYLRSIDKKRPCKIGFSVKE